jgi:hypothetical protein
MIEWIVLDWVGLDERARFACAWPSEVFMILMNFSFYIVIVVVCI